MKTREEIFRDTGNYYLTAKIKADKFLVAFARTRAGRRLLDVGCATGAYCLELARYGFDCAGVDINDNYVKLAWHRGVRAAVMDAERLGFPDKSFDTVLLFEVLEHVGCPEKIIREAGRVARKNVLITVPNNTQLDKLRDAGLLYSHFLDLDHVNFFCRKELEDLLKKYFPVCNVWEDGPLAVYRVFPRLIRLPLRFLHGLKILRPVAYYRLFAECRCPN